MGNRVGCVVSSGQEAARGYWHCVEHDAAHVVARIGDIRPRDVAVGVRRVGKLIRAVVALRLQNDAATGVVLILEVQDTSRIRQRRHPMRRIIAIRPCPAVGVRDLDEPPTRVVGILNCPADVVLCQGDAVAGVVRERDVPAIRRGHTGEIGAGVSRQAHGVRVSVANRQQCGTLWRGRQETLRKDQHRPVLLRQRPSVSVPHNLCAVEFTRT